MGRRTDAAMSLPASHPTFTLYEQTVHGTDVHDPRGSALNTHMRSRVCCSIRWLAVVVGVRYNDYGVVAGITYAHLTGLLDTDAVSLSIPYHFGTDRLCSAG